MGRIRKLTMGAVAAFALHASVGLAQAQSMVGTWNCQGTQQGVAISIQVRYEGDGSSTSSFAAAGQMNGAPMTMEGRAQGRWALEGTQLAESVERRLDRLALDRRTGHPRPRRSPTTYGNPCWSPSQPAVVVQLDEQTLVTEEYDGARLSCTRAG